MRRRADELTGTEEQASTSEHPQVVAMWPGGMIAKDFAETARLVVGRSASCDICIDHPSVSRAHAVLYGGLPVDVEDLGSTNGTIVGGRRIAAGTRTAVEAGCIVAVGAAVLVVHSAAKAAPRVSERVPRSTRRTASPAIVVADDSMRELYRIVNLFAKTDLSVVLLGETGTGKDVVAHAIHRRSPRASGPYVRLNCGAVPEALLESELFGHERGAFTGAGQAKPGIFESAHGGTLFLDEVAELPLAMQVKLLLVLENREITRIGSTRPRPIDIRVVCATNRDLPARVAAGTFRQDLYFRLNGVALTIPPLRDRPSEVAPLAREFVRDACERAGKPAHTLSRDALTALERHPWPGNVRELKNAVERAVALCTGHQIDSDHLALGGLSVGVDRPTHSGAPAVEPRERMPSSLGLHEDVRRTARDLERKRIAEALERCAGNQTRAAKVLEISRRTLVARLSEFGFARPLKGRGPESD